ncbi:Estradiol 17-beta-dehydrogenase 12, partial [Caligus rogercresseyi]
RVDNRRVIRGLRESSVTQYLALLGGSTLLYIGGRFLFDLLNGLRIHFLSKLCSLDLKKEFGEWAVVTGCTNGIGRAISIELASKGLNIALIARNPQYLEELSKYL